MSVLSRDANRDVKLVLPKDRNTSVAYSCFPGASLKRPEGPLHTSKWLSFSYPWKDLSCIIFLLLPLRPLRPSVGQLCCALLLSESTKDAVGVPSTYSFRTEAVQCCPRLNSSTRVPYCWLRLTKQWLRVASFPTVNSCDGLILDYLLPSEYPALKAKVKTITCKSHCLNGLPVADGASLAKKTFSGLRDSFCLKHFFHLYQQMTQGI